MEGKHFVTLSLNFMFITLKDAFCIQIFSYAEGKPEEPTTEVNGQYPLYMRGTFYEVDF